MLELALLVEQLGRAVVPGPFFSSAVLATLAILSRRQSRAQKKTWLPRLATRRGDRHAGVARGERPPRLPPASLRAPRKARSGYRLVGHEAVRHRCARRRRARRRVPHRRRARRGRRDAVPGAARHAGGDGAAAAQHRSRPAGPWRSRFDNVERAGERRARRRGEGLEDARARARRGGGRARRRQPRRRRARARDGGRVRQGARAVRPADRLVPGGQAHGRRDGQRDRAGALAGLVRRLRLRRAAARRRRAPRRWRRRA